MVSAQGGTGSIHDGGVCKLGWKFTPIKRSIMHFFFQVLKSVWLNKSVLRYLNLIFFWVGHFDTSYFLGVKFQAHVLFWVCNMKFCQSPSLLPIMYTANTPLAGVSALDSRLNRLVSNLSQGTDHCEPCVHVSWARHFTLTVSLSTQVYKWVLVNFGGNLTECWGVTCHGLASHPGRAELLLAASCYRNWS